MDPVTQAIFQKVLTINFLRYFLVAAPPFLLYYVFFRKRWSFKKIQNGFPKSKDYYREIGYSLVTMLIFTLVAMLVFASPLRHYNLRYDSIATHGWAYWGLSIVLMIFLHDTYFYWAHRLMHHPVLFKYLHLVHHKSTNPSPWAAYAFHPLEGVIEAAIIFPIAFLIPFHNSALMTFLMFMIVYNVYGHLGYEIFPKGFHKHWLGRWLNTSVNHNQHHKKFDGNYGLYFLFWDRWLGTIREDYDVEYELVDAKRER